MQRRKLGESGFEVPVVVLGAWAIGGWQWGGSDDALAERAIHQAIDCGMNAIDTAPVYGFGRSEQVIGRAVAGRRDSVLLFTKVGFNWNDTRGEFAFETVGNAGQPLRVYRNSRPWAVVREVEDSLKRLRTDRIDLIQVHRRDATTRIADTMQALANLHRAGKVRAIGVSNFSVEMLIEARQALGSIPLASEQPKYSLVAREAERKLLPWALRHGVGTLVYSPLEQGLLTGKVTPERVFSETDARRKRPTFTPTNRLRVMQLLDRVVLPIAERHAATPAQVVIAWTVAQPGVTCAIVGARTPEQVLENARGGELRLDSGEMASMRAAFEALQLEGVRQPSFLRRLLERLSAIRRRRT